MFDGDPRQESFELKGQDGTPLRSDFNGLLVGELRLRQRHALRNYSRFRGRPTAGCDCRPYRPVTGGAGRCV